jgi:hypothetical protein
VLLSTDTSVELLSDTFTSVASLELLSDTFASVELLSITLTSVELLAVALIAVELLAVATLTEADELFILVLAIEDCVLLPLFLLEQPATQTIAAITKRIATILKVFAINYTSKILFLFIYVKDKKNVTSA